MLAIKSSNYLTSIFKTRFVKANISIFYFLLFNVLYSGAQEIKIYPGLNVVMSGNVYLVANNIAFKNNGTFSAGTSTFKLIGNQDTTVAYISGTNSTSLYNLTVDKSAYGVALKSGVAVSNELMISAGILYTDSNLTLLSSATATARIAEVPSGANVIGKAMVERYIPARRSWRLMTGPVRNSGSIYNNWQNGGVYTPGRGLLVSGPSGINGLDNTNASSLKTFNVSTQSIVPVTNTYIPLCGSANGNADNNSYFVFIRGDRILTNFTYPNTNTTTITSSGLLQTGTQNFSASSVSGAYTLIGNPYASPIDFNGITRTNIIKRFYVWDPTINLVGGYVALDDLDNDGIYSKSAPGSSQTKVIQSSQAFFVQTDIAGAALFSITENAKSALNNTAVFRPVQPNTALSQISQISISLFKVNPDFTLLLADAVLAEFGDNFRDAVTSEDALKFTNIDENLAFVRYGSTLTIERRPPVISTDTLFFKLWKTVPKKYQFVIMGSGAQMPATSAYLEDLYLARITPLNLNDTTTINFDVTSDAASASQDRFRIILNSISLLAVQFASTKATVTAQGIEVNWKMQDESGIVKYELQRSSNSVDFKEMAILLKAGPGYIWTDHAPIVGHNYYRVKAISSSGATFYGNIVKAAWRVNSNRFTISPNPVQGKIITLLVDRKATGLYRFRLANSSGQIVFESTAHLGNNNNAIALKTGSQLPVGVYQLLVSGPDQHNESNKLIIIE